MSDRVYLLTDNTRLLFLAPQVIEFTHSTVIAVIHIGFGVDGENSMNPIYPPQSIAYRSSPLLILSLREPGDFPGRSNPLFF
jgi:hypothetical protein